MGGRATNDARPTVADNDVLSSIATPIVVVVVAVVVSFYPTPPIIATAESMRVCCECAQPGATGDNLTTMIG